MSTQYVPSLCVLLDSDVPLMFGYKVFRREISFLIAWLELK